MTSTSLRPHDLQIPLRDIGEVLDGSYWRVRELVGSTLPDPAAGRIVVTIRPGYSCKEEPMSAAFVTDFLESSAGILFDDVMLRVVEEADNELFLTAMSFFSLALDRSPETLVSDEQHRQFVVTYIQRGLLPYAEKAATLQVGLLSIAGARTPQDVFPAFLVELKKVSRVVIPHEELATRLLNDPRRSWYYFLAVVCAAGITCRRDPKLGASFGLKRSFLGQWRKLH